MKRIATVAVAAVLAAGCGSTGDPVSLRSDPTGSVPPSTIDVQYATGADDVLIRVDSGADAPLPVVVVAGDGSVYVPAGPDGMAAPPPGPPASEVSVRQLTSEGLQLVMNRAAELGLVGAPPDYDTDQAPTDQSSTTVTITDASGTYVHAAYALGKVEPESGARAALLAFVGELGGLDSLVGEEHIGRARNYAPAQWKVTIGAYAWETPDDTWPFETAPRDGCAVLEPVDGRDVAGSYTATVDGSEEAVAVTPAFPWEC